MIIAMWQYENFRLATYHISGQVGLTKNALQKKNAAKVEERNNISSGRTAQNKCDI